jgi:hypothetical protein
MTPAAKQAEQADPKDKERIQRFLKFFEERIEELPVIVKEESQ